MTINIAKIFATLGKDVFWMFFDGLEKKKFLLIFLWFRGFFGVRDVF